MRPELRAALLGLALLLPASALADWMSEYDRGLRALRAGNFDVAEAHFRAAIREKREPVERQRFQGQRFDSYVPQHWAAVAASGRGDCERALEYWEQPGLAEVLAKLPALQAEQASAAAACRQRVAAARPAEAPVAAVEPPPPVIEAPAPSAVPAAFAERPTPTRGTAVATTTAPPPAAVPPRAAPIAPAPTRPAAAPSRARAPAELASAIDAWLGGRYQELTQAQPPSMADGQARAQVLLLRAAARFVLAELDGSDAAAMAAVGTEVRAAKAANASLMPDAAMFPPRFRSYWQQVR
jgi:DNA polymerase III subunit gamma/tau